MKITFASVPTFCDDMFKMTILHDKKVIEVTIIGSGKGEPYHGVHKYLNENRALKAFRRKVGEAIIGGWKVWEIDHDVGSYDFD